MENRAYLAQSKNSATQLDDHYRDEKKNLHNKEN